MSKPFYRRYREELTGRWPHPVYHQGFGEVNEKPRKIKLLYPEARSRSKRLPPLRHDYINFKVMSGNEILLNMENAQYFRDSELINSLIELGKRKGQEDHDWEIHPYTKNAFDELKKRLGMLGSKHLSQSCLAMNRLNYNNADYWELVKIHIIKTIHLYSGKELANFLDIFVPRIEDDLEDDDVLYFDKEIEKKQKLERGDKEFLQRIINIFPVHVKDLNAHMLTRVCEVCVQRELGDDRLYKEFLFFYVEKKIHNFSIDNYVRILRVLGEKRYTDDVIFWNSYIFTKIYMDPLNQSEAHLIWEALIALRLKCPELDCEIPINYVESLLKKFELIHGYEDYDQETKDGIKKLGELPEGVKRTIQKTSAFSSIFLSFYIY